MTGWTKMSVPTKYCEGQPPELSEEIGGLYTQRRNVKKSDEDWVWEERVISQTELELLNAIEELQQTQSNASSKKITDKLATVTDKKSIAFHKVASNVSRTRQTWPTAGWIEDYRISGKGFIFGSLNTNVSTGAYYSSVIEIDGFSCGTMVAGHDPAIYPFDEYVLIKLSCSSAGNGGGYASATISGNIYLFD